jgi:mono/diheme cytochrome c family protein
VLALLVIFTVLGVWYYLHTGNEEEPGSGERSKDLGLAHVNGLEGKDRETWYHLSQGTEFFPLHFLLALNDADTGKPFMSDLERFGFIPDAIGPNNPYGLPVGMTADTTRDLRFGKVVMVGINCSACHTASLEIGGRPVLRADGGTNMFDSDRFRKSLMNSAQNTIDSPVELAAFFGRLLRQSLKEGFDMAGAKGGLLTAQLAKKLADRIERVFDAVETREKLLTEKLTALIAQELKEKPLDLRRGLVIRAEDGNRKHATAKVHVKLKSSLAAGQTAFNPDALLQPGPLAEEVIICLRLLRARLQTLKTAVHPAETTPSFGRVDAFGNARNTLFPENAGPLTAPVRYPFIWTIKDHLTWYHWDGNTQSRLERNTGEALGVGAIVDLETFESTIRFDNLDTLEKLAMRLTPPRWPTKFGDIDQRKATEGAKHFDIFCAKCHAGAKSDGSVIVPLGAIKTDGGRAKNVRQPLGKEEFYEAQSRILKGVIGKAGLQTDRSKILWRPSKDLEPTLPEGYANRAIPAVWASPPYLHNGSVPNLYQLLLPWEKRDKTFPIGHREYDVKHLGYVLKPARTLFVYDTSLPGNSNTGHSGTAYGTDQLTDEQRWELIEYLKTR